MSRLSTVIRWLQAAAADFRGNPTEAGLSRLVHAVEMSLLDRPNMPVELYDRLYEVLAALEQTYGWLAQPAQDRGSSDWRAVIEPALQELEQLTAD